MTEAAPPGRPGVRTFSLQGRAAPGLFVVGWLATLMGAGVLVAAFGARGSVATVLFAVGLAVLSIGLIAGAGSQAIERHAGGVGDYRGPSPLLVFLAVIPVSLLLQVAIGAPLQALGVHLGAALASLVAAVILLVTYLGLVRLLVVGTESLGWAEMGIRRPSAAAVAGILSGVALGLIVLFATSLFADLLSRWLPLPEGPLPAPTDRASALVNLVTAAIVAPVGEEIFFRGFATTAWLRSLGPTSAVIRGSLFFAVAHVLTISGASFGDAVGQAAFAFLVRLPVAVALGWLFVRWRSVYPTIALHATFNGYPLLYVLLRG